MAKVPDREAVKQIMNEVYNRYYLKWRNDYTPDKVEQMLQEAYAISKKYDCSLCRTMLAELIICIEEEYRRRDKGE
jgi:hypothetical protein